MQIKFAGGVLGHRLSSWKRRWQSCKPMPQQPRDRQEVHHHGQPRQHEEEEADGLRRRGHGLERQRRHHR